MQRQHCPYQQRTRTLRRSDATGQVIKGEGHAQPEKEAPVWSCDLALQVM